jgi:hypothetical protein
VSTAISTIAVMGLIALGFVALSGVILFWKMWVDGKL